MRRRAEKVTSNPKVVFLVHANVSTKGGTIGRRVIPLLDVVTPIIFTKDADPQFDVNRTSFFYSKLIFGLTAVNVLLNTTWINDVKAKILEWSFSSAVKCNADIVHSWDFFPNLYKKIKIANPHTVIVQDVPIGFSQSLSKVDQGTWGRPTSKRILRCFQYVDIFLAPSEFVKKSLMDVGVSPRKIKVIPFGVDTTVFKPGNKSAEFSIGFAGNVCHRKGSKTLLAAWRGVQKHGVKGKLNIYGRVYPEVALDVSKTPNIVTHGFVELDKELYKNHLYVFPSLLEGSSKSTYEALACGMPVITTFNAGSVVEDGVNGFIVSTGSVKQLEEKILLLYNDKKLLQKMSVAAVKRAKQFTWETYSLNVKAVYDQYSK